MGADPSIRFGISAPRHHYPIHCSAPRLQLSAFQESNPADLRRKKVWVCFPRCGFTSQVGLQKGFLTPSAAHNAQSEASLCFFPALLPACGQPFFRATWNLGFRQGCRILPPRRSFAPGFPVSNSAFLVVAITPKAALLRRNKSTQTQKRRTHEHTAIPGR